jgi:hypothetical protein
MRAAAVAIGAAVVRDAQSQPAKKGPSEELPNLPKNELDNPIRIQGGALIMDGYGIRDHIFKTPINREDSTGDVSVGILYAPYSIKNGVAQFGPQAHLVERGINAPIPGSYETRRIDYRAAFNNEKIGQAARKAHIRILICLTGNPHGAIKAAELARLTGATDIYMIPEGKDALITRDDIFNDFKRRSQIGDATTPGKEYNDKVNKGTHDYLHGYTGPDYKKGPRYTMQQMSTDPAIFDADKAGLPAEAKGATDAQLLREIHIISESNLPDEIKNAMYHTRPRGVALAQKPGAENQELSTGLVQPEDLVQELRNPKKRAPVDGGQPPIVIPKRGASVDMKGLQFPATSPQKGIGGNGYAA